MVLLMIAWLPFLLAIGILNGIFDLPGGRTLYSGQFLLISVLGGLILWALYVGLLTLFLRGKSFAFGTLLWAALASLLGVPGFGVIATLTLNQTLDRSPPEEHSTKIVRKYGYHDDHILFVDPWSGGTDAVKLSVSGRVYDHFDVGESVPIRVHRGAFGLPWVETVPLPPP